MSVLAQLKAFVWYIPSIAGITIRKNIISHDCEVVNTALWHT
jgi:hypothetical protein